MGFQAVRLVELLDEAKERSRTAIAEHNRENEEKGRPFVTFTPEELDAAAGIMGYGAVKYADLKNNRLTNYKCALLRSVLACKPPAGAEQGHKQSITLYRAWTGRQLCTLHKIGTYGVSTCADSPSTMCMYENVTQAHWAQEQR